MMEIDSEDECVTQPPDQEQAVKLASMMPYVAGQPLEAPQFLKVDWTSGQVFHERDDPDRMREPWELPQFIECKDPVLRRAQTTLIACESHGSCPNSLSAKTPCYGE